MKYCNRELASRFAELWGLLVLTAGRFIRGVWVCLFESGVVSPSSICPPRFRCCSLKNNTQKLILQQLHFGDRGVSYLAVLSNGMKAWINTLLKLTTEPMTRVHSPRPRYLLFALKVKCVGVI